MAQPKERLSYTYNECHLLKIWGRHHLPFYEIRAKFSRISAHWAHSGLRMDPHPITGIRVRVLKTTRRYYIHPILQFATASVGNATYLLYGPMPYTIHAYKLYNWLCRYIDIYV